MKDDDEKRVGHIAKAKHGFEVIKKKGILFPITVFAPYVVAFGRKRGA